MTGQFKDKLSETRAPQQFWISTPELPLQISSFLISSRFCVRTDQINWHKTASLRVREPELLHLVRPGPQ